MDVSSVSSSSLNSEVLDIYAQKFQKQAEMVEKLARIEMELSMKAEQMEFAEKALNSFYA